MADGIKTSPKFDELNFPIWKVKMTIFLQSLGSRVAKVVTKPFSAPPGDESTWSEIETKEFDANARAHYALLQALNDDDISRVIHCKSAYEIWTHLLVTHEGTSQVKRAKIDLLRSQYENFCMQENETIDDMVTRFTKITNGLSSLGDAIDNDQRVRKIIRALPPSWEVKATTLKELNDKEEMELIGLIGNLKTHEMERKAREEMAPSKKKTIAFKCQSTHSDEDDEEEDDEELSLLVKNVRRMYNKAKFQGRRRWQGGKEERKIICFNCQRPGHIVAECPDKVKPSTSKKPFKKKAMKATWDSESESEEEIDTANMCFMANESTSKVTPSTSFDDELSMDELGEAFVELSHNYDFLKKKYLKMKKENETLNLQVVTLTKEKDDLLSTLVSTKNDFDKYKISCKGKTPLVDSNEITMLKERIDSLGIVLKNCEFNKKKIEAMFPKKQAHKKNAFHAHAHTTQPIHRGKPPKHAHTSHTHHAFMYGRVFSCSHCGRKGHLANFCYDRLNASRHNVWVRNTNFQGSKKIWVPKSTNLLNDDGTFQSPTT